MTHNPHLAMPEMSEMDHKIAQKHHFLDTFWTHFGHILDTSLVKPARNLMDPEKSLKRVCFPVSKRGFFLCPKEGVSCVQKMVFMVTRLDCELVVLGSQMPLK